MYSLFYFIYYKKQLFVRSLQVYVYGFLPQRRFGLTRTSTTVQSLKRARTRHHHHPSGYATYLIKHQPGDCAILTQWSKRPFLLLLSLHRRDGTHQPNTYMRCFLFASNSSAFPSRKKTHPRQGGPGK
jgi:hypothetical protein